VPRRYVPRRGDIVWLSFTPQAGHEQAGRRPALVLSPSAYNRKVGLALFCPVTSRVKGYPFEVTVPKGLSVAGVVLADQVKSLLAGTNGVAVDAHSIQPYYARRVAAAAGMTVTVEAREGEVEFKAA